MRQEQFCRQCFHCPHFNRGERCHAVLSSNSLPLAEVTISVLTPGVRNTAFWRSTAPLPVTITFIGGSRLFELLPAISRIAVRASGYTCSASHRCPWAASRRVPAPTIAASAEARSRPMMNRSASLNPLISPPPDFPGISKLTTPSSVLTKLPTTYVRSSCAGKSQISPVENHQVLGRTLTSSVSCLSSSVVIGFMIWIGCSQCIP